MPELLPLRVAGLALVKTPGALVRGLWSLLRTVGGLGALTLWDLVLVLINNVTFKRRVGSVIPPGLPGHNGVWPEFVPPTPSDSRSPCPVLNAMANHGILPRNGRDIPLDVLAKKIDQTCNVSPTVTRSVNAALESNFGRRIIDLGDLCSPNVIEHEASLTREDFYFQPDVSKPSASLCKRLLAQAGDRPTLSAADFSRFASIRRAESKAHNPHFYMTLGHKLFGSANCAVLYEVFGGRVDDIEVMLLEERFRDGWEPRCRGRMGFTNAQFHLRTLQIELGIKSVKADPFSDAAAVEPRPERS
ncbi:hypothetical protein BOTBODRAFT_574206 [Botryobasidium botryosum FD-172 SS1]|uniref:Heme haloperoxidase family profile domain-containing protein n=1 Tax=Botryobasidium botryosum (strain FD-172 SS1) TaxID=930990 RepID=A0A067N000_BOTB1|nr:hypothetical protein BOTBODRAFT_574206 [Botryobasidium botryosum FD-172 SS1]